MQNKSNKTCINCEGTSFIPLYRFPKINKMIVKCEYCNILSLEPKPTEEELKGIYDGGYFNNNKLLSNKVTGIYGYVDYISERLNKQNGYKKNVQYINRYQIKGPNKSKLLDLGCGLGHFLDIAYDYGHDVSGVEFNNSAIEYIKNRYTYKIQTVDEFENSKETYDVITAYDVIEHVLDPVKTLHQLSSKVKTNGLLVILTTQARSITSRILGKRLEDFRRTSEHIYFFSPKNLSELLSKYGFEVLKVQSQGHSFQLDMLCQRIRNISKIIYFPMKTILTIMPFLGKINIYINPFTKFVLYARKVENEGNLNDIFSSKKLSIIMPAYNEQFYLEKIVNKVLAVDYGMNFELIIIDDGSSDRTFQIASELSEKVNVSAFRIEHAGKGRAVYEGFQKSTGDFVVIQDADLEYDPEDIKKLLEVVQKTNAYAVYGTRFSGEYRRTGSYIYTLGNNFLTMLTNLLCGLNLTDMETCYKLFDGNLIRSIKIKSKGFDFEPEITCKLSNLKIPIYETAISYNPRSKLQGKKIGVKDGFSAIFSIIKYKIFN